MSSQESVEAFVYQPEPVDSPFAPRLYAVSGPGTDMYAVGRFTKEDADRLVKNINLALRHSQRLIP
jgi:hypothetical protein